MPDIRLFPDFLTCWKPCINLKLHQYTKALCPHQANQVFYLLLKQITTPCGYPYLYIKIVQYNLHGFKVIIRTQTGGYNSQSQINLPQRRNPT